MHGLARHFRANIVGYLALFVALGGTTYAAATIGAGDIKTNAVRAKHVKSNQIKSPEVKNGVLVDDDLGLVASDTFDLGSVPAHSCVNAANVSIADADGEDLLLVVPTDNGSIQESNFDNNGELIMTGIPHPGEGHVKVCNVSAGAIDPGPQGYRMLLIEG